MQKSTTSQERTADVLLSQLSEQKLQNLLFKLLAEDIEAKISPMELMLTQLSTYRVWYRPKEDSYGVYEKWFMETLIKEENL